MSARFPPTRHETRVKHSLRKTTFEKTRTLSRGGEIREGVLREILRRLQRLIAIV